MKENIVFEKQQQEEKEEELRHLCTTSSTYKNNKRTKKNGASDRVGKPSSSSSSGSYWLRYLLVLVFLSVLQMYRKIVQSTQSQSQQQQTQLQQYEGQIRQQQHNGGGILTIIPETTTESLTSSYYDTILNDLISQITPKPSNGTLDINYKLMMMASSSSRSKKNKDSHHHHKKKKSKDETTATDASKSTTVTGTSSNFHHGFSFYVMGDTPYAFWQELRLKDQMKDIKNRYNLFHRRQRHLRSSSSARHSDEPDLVVGRNMTFLIHLGDIQKVQKTHCDESTYRNISRVLGIKSNARSQSESSPSKLSSSTTTSIQIPTLIVPGDNDWYDCPIPSQSLDYFRKHFVTNEGIDSGEEGDDLLLLSSSRQEVTSSPLTNVQPGMGHVMIHRSKEHPELFSFYMEGILFLGVHLVNFGPKEKRPTKNIPTAITSNVTTTSTTASSASSWLNYTNMMKYNMEWVATNIEYHFQTYEIRGVVIFGHALRSPNTRPLFDFIATYFTTQQQESGRHQIPVMYIHGDGHNFDIDTKIQHQFKWYNFVDIQVDQGGLAEPLIIDVAPSARSAAATGTKSTTDKKTAIKSSSNKKDHDDKNDDNSSSRSSGISSHHTRRATATSIEKTKTYTFGRDGLFRLDRQQGLYKDPRDSIVSKYRQKKQQQQQQQQQQPQQSSSQQKDKKNKLER